jgi:hypothetical protein
VRARDRAGNIGPWSSQSCVALVLDDTAFRAGEGWNTSFANNYAYRSRSRSGSDGARVTLSKVSSARIGLLVETCPTCGSIEVWLGGKRLGKLSTRSSKTKYQQMLWLPSGKTRSGKLVLEVVGNRRVYIDGIAVRH